LRTAANWNRFALWPVIFAVFFSGCDLPKQDEKIPDEKIVALEKRVSGLEADLKKVPQQKDLNDIKESIQSVKPQLERLDPFLAAFIIKRLPGEREEQWLARVKEKLSEANVYPSLGSPLVSNEQNCDAAAAGVRLTLLAATDVREGTRLYLEFNGSKDSEVLVDMKAIYVTDNSGRRYLLKSFDQTHLAAAGDPKITIHAAERIVTYLVIPMLSKDAKLFQLYWPNCGIVEFFPKAKAVSP